MIAFARIQASGQVSGAEVNIRIAHLWTFRDRIPVRGEVYAERAEALKAVGLPE